MRTKPIHLIVLASLVGLGLMMSLSACGKSPGGVDSSNVRVFDPPETSFASSLGIQGGPVTEEQARQIAEKAAGGTAVAPVEREDQDGTAVFGVLVQVGTGQKDVKVRISDGAVTQIDDGGPDGPESGD
ncbi:MAG: PepSY domain-containing protein [Candidatus Eisenbacteria bacterium]|uniref:PepSY domain-containing protein n=1 Tax=Eiseniibacteriota bacterium TaxID=2212470 RepID=A0A956SFV7_UNCEI|nr:PepSY domain-containing protein [Candidatus Eisenbacteria bacterium]